MDNETNDVTEIPKNNICKNFQQGSWHILKYLASLESRSFRSLANQAIV